MLTDAKVRAAKAREAAYKIADSNGLYLYVSTKGARSFRMNYAFGVNAAGKPAQKTLTFGTYPDIGLADARAARDQAKGLLRQGRDPAVERRVAATAQAAEDRNTFELIAERWFERNSGWSLLKLRAYAAEHGGKWSHRTARHWTTRPGLWSPVHSADVLTSLQNDVFPKIGDLPIRAIKAPKLLDVLTAVENRGAIETAHRLRQRISGVFVFGIAAGVCDADPAASLGRAMQKKPASKPQPSIVDGITDQGERLRVIRKMLADCDAERCRATTKLGLRLLALTAVRPNEIQNATWAEFEGIDFDSDASAPDALWRIPAERMKGDAGRKGEVGGEHLVPLAPQAVDVLRVLHRLTGDLPFLFPSERNLHKPISENTLRALLIRGGYYQRHVPHGFRAAFSTYMNDRPLGERKDGDRGVIDLMLAHVPAGTSGSEGAYNRAAYMPRRRELAGEWADLIAAELVSPDQHVGKPIRYAATGPGRQ